MQGHGESAALHMWHTAISPQVPPFQIEPASRGNIPRTRPRVTGLIQQDKRQGRLRPFAKPQLVQQPGAESFFVGDVVIELPD